MNKTQLIDVVAKATEMKKKDAEVAVEAVFDAIVEALADGDKVQIIGFGTFEKKHRDARVGRNPATGEAMKFAASNTPVFKAGKAFKDKVNG